MFKTCLKKRNKTEKSERKLNQIVINIPKSKLGIPGWLSGLAPALGPGHDPGDPGSSPM